MTTADLTRYIAQLAPYSSTTRERMLTAAIDAGTITPAQADYVRREFRLDADAIAADAIALLWARQAS